MKQFIERIEKMNKMYNLPVKDKPDFHGLTKERFAKFGCILSEEFSELDDIIDKLDTTSELPRTKELTEFADLLGDIVVYCHSEALKYGIPLDSVLEVIMSSNESKLGADGNPIHDSRGKVMKGPNYWKPEPQILTVLINATK